MKLWKLVFLGCLALSIGYGLLNNWNPAVLFG